MTAGEFNLLSKGREIHHAHGWIVSVLCHLFGIGAVLLVMAEIETPVLPNTFHWEVALVKAPPAMEPPAVPPSPPPVPQRQVKRPIDPHPPVKTVEAVQQTVQDVAVPVEAVTERSGVQTTESPKVVTQEVTANHTAMERVEPVAEQATVAFAPNVREAELVERESPRSDPQSSEIEHRVVEHRVVKVRQTQADYGWLRDSLWRRIEELKRYPAQARANHWEGRVVVQAVIRDDGEVIGLKIAESSGQPILDQEALAVMRKASPLILKHPLGKPSITMLIPISYKLDG
jgi:protein TonB